tara:strand:- start:47 stop:667 length:621 start_codon:yes stop_codon:yes gene_type:complete
MQTLGIILSIAAAVLNIYGFWIYNKSVYTSKNDPNATTWGVWTALGLINFFSFLRATNDLVLTFQFMTGTLGCFVTFVFCWVTGKFNWPNKTETKILAISVISLAVLLFGNALVSNYVILFAYTISWWVTARKVWKDPSVETPKPWLIWSVVFWIQSNNAVQRYDGDWIALINIGWLLVTHFTIAVLSVRWWKRRSEITCSCQICT